MALSANGSTRSKTRLPGVAMDYLIGNSFIGDNILAAHGRTERDMMKKPQWVNMMAPKPMLCENWNW